MAAINKDSVKIPAGAKAAIRAYVTQAPTTHLAEGTVQVSVTHSNLKDHRVLELRVDTSETIGELKETLYTYNGTRIEFMQLSLKDGDRLIAQLSNDDMPLAAYGVQNGHTIHVNDLDPHSLSKNGGLEDVSQIEKYRMTEDEYDKRENTLRAWKRKLLATDPERAYELFPSLRPNVPDGCPPVEDIASVEGIEVGQRCECRPGARRGTVAFIGEVTALGLGYWVGVKFDEPVGKSSGTIGSKVLFEAPPGYGGFLRGHNVTTGDFPVVDDLGLSDDEEEKAPAAPAAAAATEAAPAATAAAGAGTATSTREEGIGKYVPGSKSSGLRVVRRGGGADEDSDDNDDEL